MPHAPHPTSHSRLTLGVATFIAVFGFLPIANWIPGGRDVSWYGNQIVAWLVAIVACLGAGTILAILSRHVRWLWRDRLLDNASNAFGRSPWPAAVLLAAFAGVLYACTASLFARRPILIDEVVQLFQARVFLQGRLWLPASPHPEFFSAMHVVDTNGKVYSQFPAGGPAFLAVGAIVGAPWLIDAIYGAFTIVAFVAFLRIAEPRPGVALGAALLFALAPFTVFMSGSHMNHVPLLMCLMIAMAALAHIVSSDRPRPALALLCGLGFGCAATVRPVDALAFALPAGLWLLSRALKERTRWLDALAAGVGVAIPALALVWVNVQTTGAPFLFGYEVLWGKAHALGFHAAPWGIAHTPARGLELINLYFLRLQLYFLETPVPALLPAIVALALTRTLSAIDRYLIASGALLVGLYFAYWHDGFFLGPRFMYALLPALVLWTARALPIVRDRLNGRSWGPVPAYRAIVFGSLAAVAAGIAIRIPIRVQQYSHGLVSMRWDPDSAAASSNVRNALVLVKETWGSQLLYRMWAIGVTRTQAEHVYRNIDSCMLEERLRAVEGAGVRGQAAYDSIAPLLRDSLKLTRSYSSPDTTERVLSGYAYSSLCEQRIDDDRAGTTIYAPTLLAHTGGNVYARDLHERDRWLLRQFPGRPLYVLTAGANEAVPRFHPASRDSLERSWAAEPH